MHTRDDLLHSRGIGKWFAVSSDGHMTPSQMLRELERDKVCPVMCFEEDGETIIPIFPSPKVAEQFAVRNTGRKWTIGSMEVHEENLGQLAERGFVVRELGWPNKRSCTVVILDMGEYNVETEKTGFRRRS